LPALRTRYFLSGAGYDTDANRTNQTLMQLLASIGIPIGPPSDRGQVQRVFLTNAILCLKENGLQAPVRREWFERCSTFLRQQVEIVRPRVVVALGSEALRALRRAYGLPSRALNASVLDANGEDLQPGTLLLAVYHCGARTLNGARPVARQMEDWQRVGRALRSPRLPPRA
jgi:uracil-DNA glycosylase family 4